MKQFSLRIKPIHIIICIVLNSCISSTTEVDNRLPYYGEASFTPHWFEAGSDSLSDFHSIPAFTLINQLGDTITEKSVAGKMYVADFFFATCPGICPKMTKNMAILQDSFLSDTNVLLLSHSVTPQKDSISVLQKYGHDYGVNPARWYLLTGDRSHIYDLGRNSYFVEEDLGIDKTDDDFLHTENFVLIDQQQHIRGIYNGLNKASIQQLIADINWLQNN